MFAVACCFGGVNSVGLHDSCLNNLVVCRVYGCSDCYCYVVCLLTSVVYVVVGLLLWWFCFDGWLTLLRCFWVFACVLGIVDDL